MKFEVRELEGLLLGREIPWKEGERRGSSRKAPGAAARPELHQAAANMEGSVKEGAGSSLPPSRYHRSKRVGNQPLAPQRGTAPTAPTVSTVARAPLASQTGPARRPPPPPEGPAPRRAAASRAGGPAGGAGEPRGRRGAAAGSRGGRLPALPRHAALPDQLVQRQVRHLVAGPSEETQPASPGRDITALPPLPPPPIPSPRLSAMPAPSPAPPSHKPQRRPGGSFAYGLGHGTARFGLKNTFFLAQNGARRGYKSRATRI